uniref:Uncharacterized protein n=1 Tax=Anguilla anguilla TaxID=7936 RepID=A0A0E9UG01_ANGAN
MSLIFLTHNICKFVQNNS